MRVASTDVERRRPGERQGDGNPASGAGGGGGPEEESDEDDQADGDDGQGDDLAGAAGGAAAALSSAGDELEAPPRLGRPAPPLPGNVRVGGASLVTGPAVSDLWADSDSSDDDYGGGAGTAPAGTGLACAHAGAALPVVTPEQDEDGVDSDGDDDDFGAFGARAAAKAARNAPSKRRKRAGRKTATSPPAAAAASVARASIDAGDEATSAGTPESESDLGAAPPAVAVMGFPQLRQLSVAGYARLGAAFVAAVCRMAPPSLRRVDCRGTAVKPSQARDIAGAISRRERAAFRLWADAATAESAAEGEEALPPERAANEDDLTAVLRGGSRVTRPGLGVEADEDSHAWAMSSPADAEAQAEEGMRCDELASQWCDDDAGSEEAVEPLGAGGRSASDEADGCSGTQAVRRAWLDGEHADDPIVFGSARPEPSATSILVAAGPRTMHMQGRSAVDAVEDRGAMTPCQLDCVWEAAVELLGIDE